MLDALEKEIGTIVNRAVNVVGKGEEATKQALVLPWLNALGYDIWNPKEVCPEFESDTAIKKAGQKEKVDLAIIIDDQPVIFIEVKPLGEPLSGHQGQLKRYFNSTPSVSLGVLTNGLEYRFYTDSASSNIMDDEPFHISRLDSPDQGLDIISRFAKRVFSANEIRDYATELKFTARIESFLTDELDLRGGLPTESFVRWVLGEGIYDGIRTAATIERFTPIVKVALQRVQVRQVRRSLARMEEGLSSQDPEVVETVDNIKAEDPVSASPSKTGEKEKAQIVTTEEELQAFDKIKSLASALMSLTIYDPSSQKDEPVELKWRDTSAYFSVFLNKSTWWVLRLNFDAKQKWIGFPIVVEESELPAGFQLLPETSGIKSRIQIAGVSDLDAMEPLILRSINAFIADKDALRKA